MPAYYNENDAFAAQWLRNLMEAGHIAPGDVDERDVREVKASDLEDYEQVHLFAGIGVWSYALRLAGWPDDLPVWTGSCPCQPFSGAGKRKGFDDERHLWPAFSALVAERRPPVVLGEQVASEDGFKWLDVVSADLEAQGYAFGAADLPASGVGAPHTRQRLYWVAHRGGEGLEGRPEQAAREEQPTPERGRDTRRLGDLDGERRQEQQLLVLERRSVEGLPEIAGNGEVRGFWDPADWVLCRDPGGHRWRPVEPGTFPLAARTPGDLGRLRAYGNSIVAPLAAEFVRAVMDCLEMNT